MTAPDFARVASLAGDPARAAILEVLFDGRAFPAGQLAALAGISAATASAHLAKLREAGLVRARTQGRHRYYELEGPHVAQALEALAAISAPARARSLCSSLRAARLRFARSCYNHLAGELAIAIVQALARCGALDSEDDGFRLREGAHGVLAPLGVDVAALFRSPGAHVRGCIDWTERRAHIAGPLGSALLDALLRAGAVRRRSEPRALELTPEGSALLERALGLELPLTRRPAESSSPPAPPARQAARR